VLLGSIRLVPEKWLIGRSLSRPANRPNTTACQGPRLTRHTEHALGVVTTHWCSLGASGGALADGLLTDEVHRQGLHEHHRGTGHLQLHPNQRGRHWRGGLYGRAATHRLHRLSVAARGRLRPPMFSDGWVPFNS
jgi:hypothetical protein